MLAWEVDGEYTAQFEILKIGPALDRAKVFPERSARELVQGDRVPQLRNSDHRQCFFFALSEQHSVGM
jgi:hypothetical protein